MITKMKIYENPENHIKVAIYESFFFLCYNMLKINSTLQLYRPPEDTHHVGMKFNQNNQDVSF